MNFYAANGNLRKNFSDKEFIEICSLTPWIEDNSKKSIRERVYCINNNIFETPKCVECGNNVNFLRSNKYAKYCSNFCKNNSSIHNNLIVETLMKNYGVTTPLKSHVIKERAKQTFVERYDVEHQMFLQSTKDLIVSTCLERYGVTNGAQTTEARNKISISMSKRFCQRRNIENTDYKGFVYILHFPEIKTVKIGLSANLEKRFFHLKKTFGDFNILNVFETDKCFELESKIHKEFDDFRICLQQGSGRTEFFNENIIRGLYEKNYI